MTKCNSMSEETEEFTVHGWLFHYNCYTHKWNAFPSGESRAYFNGTCKAVISGKEHEDCIDKILDKHNV